MGGCYSCCRRRKPRDPEREPLLPKYAPEVPPQSQFDKLADLAAALSAGKYPSQDQINGGIQVLLRSEILKTGSLAAHGPLSARGRLLIDDVRGILDALLVLGSEKNSQLPASSRPRFGP